MSSLLRGAELSQVLPISRSHRYALIADGLLPKPIKIGPRSAAYIAEEVHAVLHARAAGLAPEKIKALVADLEAARRHADAEARRAAALRRALGAA